MDIYDLLKVVSDYLLFSDQATFTTQSALIS